MLFHGWSSTLSIANTTHYPPNTNTFSTRFKPTAPQRWETCSFPFQISLMQPFSQQNGRWEEELLWNSFGILYSLWNLHAQHSKAQANVKLWVTDINRMANPGCSVGRELNLNWLSWDWGFKQRWGIPTLVCYRWHSNPAQQWIKVLSPNIPCLGQLPFRGDSDSQVKQQIYTQH